MDKIAFGCIIAIIISSTVIAGIIILDQINECTADPLKYAAQKFEKDYGNPFYGDGRFNAKTSNPDFPNKTFFIVFNNTGWAFKKEAINFDFGGDPDAAIYYNTTYVGEIMDNISEQIRQANRFIYD